MSERTRDTPELDVKVGAKISAKLGAKISSAAWLEAGCVAQGKTVPAGRLVTASAKANQMSESEDRCRCF